jgi:outer membrane immunogenic protein
MRKLLLSSTVFVALGVAGSAIAADLPVYTKAPPPYVPDFSWTGFYAGVNAGYGWSTDGVTTSSIGSTTGTSNFLARLIAATNTAAVPTSFKNDPNGFLGGVQAGYNWQVNRQWVFGVETDFQGADIKGSDTRQGAATGFVVPPFLPLSVSTLATSEQKIDSLGTLRARLGFIPWDSHLLVYATGGLAYGHVESSTSYSQMGCLMFICRSPTGAAGSASGEQVGWSAGGGLEYAFARNWSLKTEYLHYDLGSVSYALSPSTFTFGTHSAITNTTATAKFTGDIVRAGVNYRF